MPAFAMAGASIGAPAGSGRSAWLGSSSRSDGTRRRASWRLAGSKETGADAGAAGGTPTSWITKPPAPVPVLVRVRVRSWTVPGGDERLERTRSGGQQAGREREVEPRRRTGHDRDVASQRLVGGQRGFEGLRAAVGEEDVEPGVAGSGERGGRAAVRQVFDGRPGQARAAVRVADRSHDEAAGQHVARERADLHVIRLPPPGEAALIVEARRDGRASGGEGHVGDLLARAGHVGLRLPDGRPGRPPSSLTSTLEAEELKGSTARSLAHWMTALVLPERSIGGVTNDDSISEAFAGEVDDRVRPRTARAVAVEVAAGICSRVDLPARAEDRPHAPARRNHAAIEAFRQNGRPDEGAGADTRAPCTKARPRDAS